MHSKQVPKQPIPAQRQSRHADGQFGPAQGRLADLQLRADTSPAVRRLRGIGQLAQGAEGGAIQRAEAEPTNNTGLPNDLKAGVENLSGMSMDHVKVHRNSDKPAQVGAHAYAQGSDIHLAAGQERHLPHEAWHVVQQAQGRVKPTMQMKGVAVNDDAGLEKEADVMGARAMSGVAGSRDEGRTKWPLASVSGTCQLSRTGNAVLQRTEVPVSGGVFKDIEYKAENGEFGRGAFINMEFAPSSDLGEDGDTISLVQTVKDYTVRKNTDGGDATLHPTTSQLGNRKLAANDAGVSADDAGTGIDQEVLNSSGDLVNTDPRYTEERMDATGALNTEGKSSHFHSVRSAKKGDAWSKARLNDAPEVSLKLPGFHWKNNKDALATLTGGMDFEIAALDNTRNEFVGSVKWGWRMSGKSAELNPSALTLADKGAASARLFKAADKWNKTKLIAKDGSEVDPMQLPVDPEKLKK